MKKAQLIMVWFLPLIVIGGLFNPWLGYLVVAMMVFFLTLSFFRGRYWCWNLCPRGAFLDIVISKLSVSRPLPKIFIREWFRLLIFILFVGFVIFRIIHTGGNLLMIGSVFVVMCILTTIISIILGILTKHRGWCAICPMGFLQEKIGKINRESSHAHSGGAFYRFLAHLGFGLVTYLPLIFFAVDLFIRRGSDMKGAIATAFSFSAYTLVLGTLGWKFAVPALIIAGIGLSKVKCLKLNVATVAISIIILLWNFLSVTIGG